MEVKGNAEKRKAIKGIVELGIVFVALVLCFVPILGARKSSGATGAFLDEIIGDVRTYYNSIKDNHKMKVSVTTEDFRTKANLIYDTFQSIGIDPDELVSSSDSISTIWRNLDGKIKDGSAKPNILTGYIRIKRRVDSYFVKSTQSNCNLQVTEAPYYYKYAQVEAPEATAEKVFLDTSRILKRRVEDLILVYQVHQIYSKNTNGGKTGGAKYLAALRKEIVDAARWGNYWKSTQYIDISEAAYAVSLGYDYIYKVLSPGQRRVIENRLLLALLFYSKNDYSKGLDMTFGNLNQVGHSGAGIAALTLLDSSDEGEIKIVSVDKTEDNKRIAIKFPVKAATEELSIEYKDKLLGDKYNAEISDDALCTILFNKYSNMAAGQSIPLRIFYSAVIARTMDSLPKVLKSNNMYIDGSYPEGRNYYLYGMRYYSYYLATLRNTLQNDYSLLKFEGANNETKNRYVFNNIVLNPIYNANGKGGAGGAYDYGDASINTVIDSYTESATDTADSPGKYGKEDDLLYLANVDAERGFVKAAKAVYDYRKRTAKQYWSFYSIMWYDETYDTKKVAVDYDEVFNPAIYHNSKIMDNTDNVGRIGVGAFRSSFTDSDGIFVAMKGGNNGGNHVHLDLGSYVLDAMGTRWIADAGSQYGQTGYHDRANRRWQYYTTRAEAHSTIVVNDPGKKSSSYGDCLGADQWIGAKAPFTQFGSSENSNFAILKLTQAYNRRDNDDLNSSLSDNGSSTKISVKRGLKLFDHKKYVLVQDEVTLLAVKKYYSFLNVGKNVTNVRIVANTNNKEAELTDASGNVMRVVLKSNNSDVEFRMVDSITNNTGLVNKFINDSSVSTNCYDKGANSSVINHNKLVVYAENSTAKNMTMKIGVFYIPSSSGTISSSMLKLNSLSSWHMPSKPTIEVDNNGSAISANASIQGSAVVKISADDMQSGDVIKYSLDKGTTWHTYNESDSADVQRRTYSNAGNYRVTVWSYVDDGAGVQGDTAKLADFSFSIKSSETYKINKYSVNESKKYIDLIDANTTLTAFKENITLGSGYSVSVDLGDKSYIYTGSITKIYNGSTLVVQYTNIVRGDINSDGTISSLDYVKVKNHIMGTKLIAGEVLQTAADANQDGKISSLDYVRIKNIIMN